MSAAYTLDHLKDFQNRPKTTIHVNRQGIAPKRPNDLIELSAYGRDSPLFARYRHKTKLAPLLLYIPRLCDQPDAIIWFREDSKFANVSIRAARPTDPLNIGGYGGFIDNAERHRDSFSSCAPRDSRGGPLGGGGLRGWFISMAQVAENARLRGMSVPQPVAKRYDVVPPPPIAIEPNVIDLTTKRKRVPPNRDDFLVGGVGTSHMKHARTAEPVDRFSDCDSSDDIDVEPSIGKNKPTATPLAVETSVASMPCKPASPTYQPRKKESDRLSPTASFSEFADHSFKVYEDMLHEPDLPRWSYDVVRGAIYGEGGRTVFEDPRLSASQVQESARIRKYCDDLLPRFYPSVKMEQ